MANTIKVVLTDTDWTDVSGTSTKGYVTIDTVGHKVVVAENSVKPTASSFDGHTIDSYFRYSELAVGQKIWAKSSEGNTTVYVTPGD